jgi:hypothetical protein
MANAESGLLQSAKKEKPEMPKGGRKGGKIFPRIGLEQALAYAKRLVSKTAIAPQPEATVLAGVFDNSGSDGKIRLSAVKQFGLLDGTATAYKATQLARDIEAAADDAEKLPLIRRAMLTSKIFQELYNTYQGDQTTKAKIKGRVIQLGVHPDVSEDCADFFLGSATTAKLATPEGEGFRILPATQISIPIPNPEDLAETSDVSGATEEGADFETPGKAASEASSVPKEEATTDNGHVPAPRPRTAADVTVNLTVDSSLDGEKLEKQLALLRRYGLI